ncbi:3860_t:CDS:2, partial [Entrophospora sp. SA101]
NQMEHENENQMEHENENQMEHENENQTEHENENQLEHENENQLEYENENQLEDENENQLEDEKENQLEHGKENQLEHGKENQLEHGKENQLEHGKENQFHRCEEKETCYLSSESTPHASPVKCYTPTTIKQSNKRPIKSASPFLGEKRRRYEQVLQDSSLVNLDLENHQLSDILEILIAADELILDELTEHIQIYLMEETFWLPENIVQVIQTVFPFETCKNLQNYCTEIICHNPTIIFESDDFYKMDKQILVNLLKRNDFAIGEHVLWDHLIKWDEFKMLEDVLQDCIPEIRFSQMTSEEFYKSVYPYRKILPKNLKHDLICSYLSKNHISESLSIIPAREKNIDLLFISPPQASLIESWINCTTIDHISLTISTTKLQYRWNLLYQGSRDGFSPVVFHEKCDNQGRCVVITKIRNSTTIIGGYNPIGWYSSYGYYEETQDSFICLFKNFYDLKNYKLSRVISPENAIFQQNEFGPDFGEPDFLLFGENNETYCTTGCAYEEAIDLGHFEVDDYVVYQIVSNNEELVEEEKNNNIK